METNWTSPMRVLAWSAAIALVVAALLSLALAFDLLGAPPQRGEGMDFVDFTVARLEWDRSRLPLDAGASLLFALAFLALAGIGWLIGRSTPSSEGGGALVAAAFVVAGVLGAAAQLVYVGAAQVATDPIICDCGYRAEEIIGRLEAVHVASAQQTWLTHGASVAMAAGFFVIAGLRRARGAGQTWPMLSASSASCCSSG